jgi:NAD-dependent deacetylase
MKKLVVLTGAGISAESGIKTFRDSGGLWEEYDVMDVASIEGWFKDQSLVLQFYNARRKQLKDAEPNEAHIALVELEKHFDVQIITQNIDNLHERAGSKNVLHLHGLLTQAKSSQDDSLVYDIGYDEIHPGDTCDRGSQLRPNVVWFGEAVPAISKAAEWSAQADIYVIIGTSLNVYPAAGLVDYVPRDKLIYIIDPNDIYTTFGRRIEIIKEKAVRGTKILKEKLLKK